MKTQELLRDKKLKVTPARIELIELFKREKKPLSYEDIKDTINMDRATFYRNMNKFEEVGLFSVFESNSKIRFFEFKLTPHAHFICIECHSIECIKSLDIKLDGYEVHNMTIKGRCKNCTL